MEAAQSDFVTWSGRSGNKRPDLDVVAVCPWKGSLAEECARTGIRTKIAWMPGWAYLMRSPTPRIEALIGALPRVVLLISGILPAVLLLVRQRPTLVLTNTMVIPAHAIAAKLLGIPHYWMVREFGRDDHQLWFLLGHRRTVRLIGRLSESVICNSHAVEKALLAIDSKMTDPRRPPGRRHPARLATGAPAGRAHASCVGRLFLSRQGTTPCGRGNCHRPKGRCRHRVDSRRFWKPETTSQACSTVWASRTW